MFEFHEKDEKKKAATRRGSNMNDKRVAIELFSLRVRGNVWQMIMASLAPHAKWAL